MLRTPQGRAQYYRALGRVVYPTENRYIFTLHYREQREEEKSIPNDKRWLIYPEAFSTQGLTEPYLGRTKEKVPSKGTVDLHKTLPP